MKDVFIHDLQLRADEVVAALDGGKRVLGPAGDVVQLFRTKDQNGLFQSNPLVAAQVALAKDMKSQPSLSDEEKFSRYGSTYIPESVINWADDKGKLPETFSYQCHKDAMGHHNKGVVGVRLNSVNKATLDNVTIKRLSNEGAGSGLAVCADSRDTLGNDARGFTAILTPIQVERVTISDITSLGESIGVELRHGATITAIDGGKGTITVDAKTVKGGSLVQMLSTDVDA